MKIVFSLYGRHLCKPEFFKTGHKNLTWGKLKKNNIMQTQLVNSERIETALFIGER